MRIRPIAITLLSLALLAVLGLCGLTAYGSYQFAHANRLALSRNEQITAESTETVSYPVDSPLELVIDTELGDIVVEAGQPGQVTAEITKRGWGETQAEAEQVASALHYQVNQTPGRLSFTYTVTEPMRTLFGVDHADAVSFKLTVPPDTAVQLIAGNGAITLSGTRGDARLENHFGDIVVSDLEGGLTVKGSTVTVKKVDAGKAAVELASTFGELVLEDVRAGEITLSNGSGPTRLARVKAAGKVDFTSSFGEVTVEELQAGELALDNQGGALSMTGVEIAGTAKVGVTFGDLSLNDVRAETLTVNNQGGPVTIDGVSGVVDVQGAFGEVKITHATQVALAVKTAQGPVHFSGSLDPQAEHSIQTGMGDVTLTLPADSAFKLDLKTNMGRIQSELPVTLSGGLSESSWSGTLNEGVKTLTIETESGNIQLEELK